jgi:hypothetical protein
MPDNFVTAQTRRPQPKSYTGLDLGQRHDHSALATLHLIWIARAGGGRANLYQPELTIGSLVRFPLGTDYDDLHRLVSHRLAQHRHRQELVIDAGGPGPPMIDRFRNTLSANIAIRPVIITGGKGESALPGGYMGISRRSLIATLMLAIAAQSLTCDEDMPHWEIFEEELIELRGDTTHPGDSNGHDDLVMAVALALSAAVRDAPQLLPETENKSRRNPLPPPQ